MKQKKVLRVDYSSSKKIDGWRLFYQIFGWLFLVGGIITTIVGIVNANEILYPETTTLYVGISLVITSLVFLFNSALLRGIGTLVENAEFQKAIVEQEYKVQDFDVQPVGEKAQEEEEKDAAVTKFKVGQLVIVKEDESQFKVSEVMRGEDGVVLYFSDKFDRYFGEDEIEDFAEHWEKNKKN